MSRARVFPRLSRSILTRTGGYLSGFTHTLQPYSGCQFSCRYCYVREMAVQRTNPFGLPWSHWIAPKTNAPQLLARAAARGVLATARVFCSSATDPYTPLERRLALTRGCLEVMAADPPAALLVQTRSPLVLRDDVALLRKLPCAGVSLTVTTADESVRRRFEPDSPSIERRIATLAALRAAGIRVQAAIAPLLPGDSQQLAERLDPVVDRVVVDDFFRGDGAGGRRSQAALESLEKQGFGRWAEPGYAVEATAVLRRVLGPGRVAESQAGFNDTGWLGSARLTM
jgi:DNA repair photolyase